MAPNYMPSMNFFYRLIAIFSLLGLANGLFFMASIRTLSLIHIWHRNGLSSHVYALLA